MIRKAYKGPSVDKFCIGPGICVDPGRAKETSLARGASNLFLLAYPPCVQFAYFVVADPVSGPESVYSAYRAQGLYRRGKVGGIGERGNGQSLRWPGRKVSVLVICTR